MKRIDLRWFMTAVTCLALAVFFTGCPTEASGPDPSRLTITGGFEGSLYNHGVHVFPSTTNLSTPQHIQNAMNGPNIVALGGIAAGTENVFTLMTTTAGVFWTGSGSFQVVLMNLGGGIDNAENPMFRRATAVSFSNGSASVGIGGFAPVVVGGGGMTTVFDLANDAVVQALPLNTPITDQMFEGTPFRYAGASFMAVQEGGRRALHFSTGDIYWRGLRIDHSFVNFAAGDTIRIAGRVVTGTVRVHLCYNINSFQGAPLGGWDPVFVQGNAFEQEFTLSAEDVSAIIANAHFGNPSHLQLRTRQPGSEMIITELVIRGERPQGWTPDNGNGNGGPGNGGDDGAIPAELVGDWGIPGVEGIVPDMVMLTINADGTGAFVGIPASWSEAGGRLTVNTAGITGSAVWEIVGGRLRFSDGQGNHGAALEVFPDLYRLGDNGGPGNGGDNGAIPAELVGDWGIPGVEGIVPDMVMLTINADGTGAFAGIPASWSEAGGRLTVNTAGITGSAAWEIVGGRLRFSDGQGDHGAALEVLPDLYRLGDNGGPGNGGDDGTIPAELVGDWGIPGVEGIVPDMVMLTINADGTGAFAGIPASWSEAGGRLTVNTAGITGSAAWEIVGGRLRFSDGQGDHGAALEVLPNLYRLGDNGGPGNGGDDDGNGPDNGGQLPPPADPSRLVINNFAGGTLTHVVYVFTPATNLSTPEAIANVILDGWVSSGTLTLGYANKFLMTRGWEGSLLMPGEWTGSGTFQLVIVYNGGVFDDVANPMFRLATVAFTDGSARVDIDSFAPVVTAFTVTFDSNGGSTVPPQRVNIGTPATRPEDPARLHRTFVNWYRDAALTTVHDFSTLVTQNITLFARWEYSAFTVTFNSTGGSHVPNQFVDIGGVATRPEDPSWQHRTFVGWYADSDLTTAYDFSAPVTWHITLFAKWEYTGGTISVTNNANSGPGSLRYAIGTVPPGYTIYIEYGVGTIRLESPLEINRSLTIKGNGTTLTRSAAWTGVGNMTQLLRITSSVATVGISRMHFTGGRANSGAAINHGGGTLILESSIFSNNVTGSGGAGGAIWSGNNGTLIANGNTFFRNSAGGLGGAIQSSGANSTVTLTGNLFHGNTSVLRPVVSGFNVVSGGFNVVDLPFGTGDNQNGWLAGTGDMQIINNMPILPGSFRPFANGDAAGVITSLPAGYPMVDFYGDAIVAPAAAGAAQSLVAGYFLNLTANNSSRGSVESSPSNETHGLHSATLTATSAMGEYIFSHWLVDGTRKEGNPLYITLAGHSNAQAVFRAEFTVSNPSDAANSANVRGTLRHAITNSMNGDSITFNEATTIVLTRPLQVNRNITIDGNSSTLRPSATWLADFGTSSLLRITSTATVNISRIHFRGGRAINTSAAINNAGGTLTLESNIFSDNVGEDLWGNNAQGGAVRNGDGGTLIARGNTFFGNRSGTLGGGAILSMGINSTVILTGNLFYGNTGGNWPVVRRNLGVGIITSGGFNVVDVPLGTGNNQSGWTAGTGDTTLGDLGISGIPFDEATFAPVDGLRNVMPGTPIEDFPAIDFNGNPRTWPGAPGAVNAP